ncbi:MAG: DUF4214 domain-containing protein [Actinomycetota bacterium]
MAKTINSKKLLYIIPLTIILIVGILFSSLALTNGVEVKGSSTDGTTAFVTRMYQQTLNRQPDPAGLNSWVSQLKSGNMTGADVANNFILSNEFKSRNLSDQEFINVMYGSFFGRAPDPGGLNDWMSALSNGTSREQVMAGFINSEEFKNIAREYGINPGSVDGSKVYSHPEVNVEGNSESGGANLNGYEQQTLAQINNIRVANGLNALAPNQALTNVARQRSADMLNRGYFSHYTPEGTSVFNLLKGNGISYRNAGENLAHSKPASAGSVGAFMNAWMNSPTHAANILRGVYGQIGIGIAENNGRRVVTTVFMN